ncbi:hypothetical protein BH10ACT3_BH10ACT3_05300 [soil metagenome]
MDAVVSTPLEQSVPLRSPADRFMRRLLFLPVDGPAGSIAGTEGVFSKSILISATRCLLMYVLLPLLAPIIHLTGDTTPIVGLVLAIISMGAITYSMRRFFGSDHKYRWGYAAIGGSIFLFMLVGAVINIDTLLTR